MTTSMERLRRYCTNRRHLSKRPIMRRRPQPSGVRNYVERGVKLRLNCISPSRAHPVQSSDSLSERLGCCLVARVFETPTQAVSQPARIRRLVQHLLAMIVLRIHDTTRGVCNGCKMETHRDECALPAARHACICNGRYCGGAKAWGKQRAGCH